MPRSRAHPSSRGSSRGARRGASGDGVSLRRERAGAGRGGLRRLRDGRGRARVARAGLLGSGRRPRSHQAEPAFPFDPKRTSFQIDSQDHWHGRFLNVIGTTLSHYRIVNTLGAGGMGEVYLARDEHLDRDVAVKVLQRGMLADPAARERFRREARVLARLSHPGVATIYDFDTQESVDFLVMEYVPGGTISSRLASGPFPVGDVIRLGASIADALEAAHRRGFLHRDLKPGNVVLTADGAPKLLDFGLAGLLISGAGHTELTQTGTVMGSLPYMAPEQLRGEPADLRSDVWALG